MMEYKSQNENNQNRLKNVSNICHVLRNENPKSFSLDNYLTILNAVIKSEDSDEIYNCLDELIDDLYDIEFIELDIDEYNSQKLLLFNELIIKEELDIKIKSCQCVYSLISKCDDIGYFFYNSNIIGLISQKIQDNENSVLSYRFFDIICSLSLLDQNILESILEDLPVSLWIQLLQIKEIHNQFSEYLVTISNYSNYDFSFQSSIFAIFSKMIEENQTIMFKAIAKSINQLMNKQSFQFDLFFEMNFQDFIISLLYSENPEMVSLSLQVISKSIHFFFYVDQKAIEKILSYANPQEDIKKQFKYIDTIRCNSLDCLSAIIKANQDVSDEVILKEEFLSAIACFYQVEDYDYQVKICITDFLLDCLLFSNFDISFFLIIDNNLFESFAFLFNSDNQLILEKLLFVIERMIVLFEYNQNSICLESKMNDYFPLDVLDAIRDSLDDEVLILLDNIIEKIYGET